MGKPLFRSIVAWTRQDAAESPIAPKESKVRTGDSTPAPRASDATEVAIDQALLSICGAVKSILAEIRCVDAALGDFRAKRQRSIPDRLPLCPVDRDLNFASISRRERVVLACLAQGKSNREISNELRISEKTVKNHLWKVYRKFGVKSRTQLLCRLLSP